jgi:Aerotolerance regulator N-terminal/von Willebrand factor type A domain
MPLAFLVPAFLAGLIALAVPILVHLRHRERKDPVRFPSLMFLRRIPFREVSRQQIHHWPLFLLRCLAVALLVAAFARPFFRDRASIAAPATPQGRELVLLLDRSASMGYGTRWERARAAVREAVDAMQSGDRASLVLFDATPAIAVSSTTDRALLRAGLAAAAPTARAARLAPALRTVRELLVGSDQPTLEVLLVSDFQRSGWRGEAIEPLPEGTILRRVDLSTSGAPNLALVAGDLLPSGDALTVSVQVLATGSNPAAGTRASLELDGRPAGSRDLTFSGREAVSVTFPPVTREQAGGGGLTRGVVRLGRGDSLAVDDAFHFVARRERPVRVLIRRSPGANPARLFLDRALAVSRRPRMEITRVAGPISAANLATADVVVLDDVPFPSGDAGRRLADFVARGGGLIQILGAGASGEWPPALGGLETGAVVERDEETGGTIGLVRREHPLFEPFRAPGSGDFAATRVYRYRRVRADSLEVLARFDDGAPALLEALPTVARTGRALAFTSSADNLWNDLPLQPVFLPLVHQLVLYAARHVEPVSAQPVSEVATVSPDRFPAGGARAVVVVTPSGERLRRTVGAEGLSVALDEAGFYEVREAGPGGRVLEVLAANPSPEEADLAPFDPADLVIAAGARDSARAPTDAAELLALTAAERERSQSLWWFVLAALALLLSVELLFANRLTGFVRAEPPPPPGAVREVPSP